jgi:hypothetical protein
MHSQTLIDTWAPKILEPPKLAKKAALFIKYGLTKENLIDRFGRVITDRIALKASEFIEHSAVEILNKDRSDNNGYYWTIVKPILGYNRTTYTQELFIKGDDIVGGCNCQYGHYDKLCSHLLAVLVEIGLWPCKLTVRGGVRAKLEKTQGVAV